jgi:hypothetical protein
MQYLCIAGIIYILIHSIYLRRMLLRMGMELDEDHISPSDFAIIARHLPLNLPAEKLKERFENHFAKENVKIVYINYTYKVDEMVRLTGELKSEYRKKGIYLQLLRKFMKEKNISHDEIKRNPSLFPAPKISTGIFKK